MSLDSPRIVVFTTLFPHPGQPTAGLFIRERMFRVGKSLPMVVIAPVPWFPFQRWLRKWRPHFRPDAPRREIQSGIEVLHPRFLSVPGIFKSMDGLFLAMGSLPTLWKLKKRFDFQLIDAHFAYPDGYAAMLLSRWLRIPFTVTLRGTEARLSKTFAFRRLMMSALSRAARVFSVAESLKKNAVAMGIPKDRILVVGNGVDRDKFQPIEQGEARRGLRVPLEAPVLVSIGGLCERKGFHRVIECLPDLKIDYPGVRYLIVGGPSAEGDWTDKLKQQVAELGLEETVHFMGPMPPECLNVPLSAADVFVLATRNEGWANVFLEAMSCGLPVVTTDVGGNMEVVCKPELGAVVQFGDQRALTNAIKNSLNTKWCRESIIDYARANSWDQRVTVLIGEFKRIVPRECENSSDMKATIEGL